MKHSHFFIRHQFKHQLFLRVILIVPFVMQIFAAVGLVGYLSFRNSQETVNDLANQLMEKTSSTVNQHLNHYLSTPHQINRLNADAVKMKRLNLKDLRSAGQYFWKQAEVFENISWIGFALPTGEVASAGRWIPGQGLVTSEVRKNQEYSYSTNHQGDRTKLVYQTEYNALEDEWYTQTVKAGKPIWSQIYTSEGIDSFVAVSANYPIYDQKRQLVAVLGIDLLLSKINDFLQKLQVSPHSQVFIIERNGLLIANSSSAANFRQSQGTTERIYATASNQPLIQATSQYLHQKFLNFANIRNKQSLDFDFQGKRHYISVDSWQDKYGLDWLVVIVLPEADFMGQIHAQNRITILLCLGALAIATLVGVYTSRWITLPIFRLTVASQAIAAGDLQQKLPNQNIRELEILAQSFNQMAAQLQAAFNDLEQTNNELELRVESRTRELQDTQAQLIQTEKMSSLGQMVAGIAHEINNPVSFIHGNLNYAQEYVDNLLDIIQLYQKYYPHTPKEIHQAIENIDLQFIQEDLTKILTSMAIGTERIREIVLGLRNFSRLGEAELKKVDIHEGIDSTLMILKHRLKANNQRPEIKIILEYSNVPIVECFPGQLNQVFMNIIANAIDAFDEATEEDSQNYLVPTIWVRTRVNSSESVEPYLEVAIADNGMGITPETQKKLFDPFFTTKPVGKGTGLGLSISYQIIVEKHRGKLTCLSQPRAGTEFVIAIPIQQSSQ
ncbi:ATP-binding protein [Calothrix sp. 336/3]|uniref:ATP-binding protein n=1 Tax=Calothrix sp. 336/3 TaxID=1337936 RepID=UPI0004E3AB8C|nr:ATP-binding protein [Calothrix sp. 336/3]AKG22781.1 histidine kinase [Calothrix sp. 336/3]